MTRRIKVKALDDKKMDGLVEELRLAEQHAALANDKVKELKADIEGMLAESGKRTWTSPTTGSRVTRVTPEPVHIDEARLKKRLGATLWNRITTRVLDKNKLDAYIKSGEINANTVAACSEVIEGKSYIRTTHK